MKRPPAAMSVEKRLPFAGYKTVELQTTITCRNHVKVVYENKRLYLLLISTFSEFVRIRSNYEKEFEKASICAASFFPSKFNYDQNFFLLMDLGNISCSTAESTLISTGFSVI